MTIEEKNYQSNFLSYVVQYKVMLCYKIRCAQVVIDWISLTDFHGRRYESWRKIFF